MMSRSLAVRWTIGDVSERGFEALRLSVWGAHKQFGADASYVICTNNVRLDDARKRSGPLPSAVQWHDATREMPAFLRELFDAKMAEGVGWKLAPLRLFPDRYELSLDNDCILWETPPVMRQWLDGDHGSRTLLAEDVTPCFGQFAELCPAQPRNSGIRGLPPGFALDAALRHVLEEAAKRLGRPVQLTSELDEQGLQTAALSIGAAPLCITVGEVSICSPFQPHSPHLGSCGAHFVGLNSRHIPWSYYDRPADEWMAAHWNEHRKALYDKTGARDKE